MSERYAPIIAILLIIWAIASAVFVVWGEQLGVDALIARIPQPVVLALVIGGLVLSIWLLWRSRRRR